MTAITIHAHVDADAVVRAFATAPDKFRAAIRLSLGRSAVYTQGMFVRNMPEGVTGALRRSVIFHFNGNNSEVTIEPTADQADYIEYGTRPHMPPVNSLRVWAAAKGISPWAVAMGIAKHGTRPQPYLEKTANAAEKYAGDDMDDTIDLTVGEINA